MTTSSHTQARVVVASSPSVAVTAGRGALTGAIASVAMGAAAMMAAATYQGLGFFTPLYHIASTVISPATAMASMQHAAAGSTFYLAAGPAALGLVIHMMVGAMYGIPFALAAGRWHLASRAFAVAGTAWGAVVFVVSSFVGLPLAAAIFGSGDQITHMAARVGYGTFLGEHLVYGAALGLLLTAASRGSARRVG